MFLQKERKTGETLIGSPEARASVIDRTVRSALVHEPGEAAVYGDLDFIVLGAVVEAVGGQRLDDFCREHGSSDRSTCPTPSSFRSGRDAQSRFPSPTKRRIAATENCPWRDRVLWGEVHDPNASVMGGVAGHAGLFARQSTMIVKFGETIIDVWHGRSDALPRDPLRQFLTRQKMPENRRIGRLDGIRRRRERRPRVSIFPKNSVGHLGFTGTSLWIDLDREADDRLVDESRAPDRQEESLRAPPDRARRDHRSLRGGLV